MSRAGRPQGFPGGGAVKATTTFPRNASVAGGPAGASAAQAIACGMPRASQAVRGVQP
jgi:hypothetical protein